MAALTKDRPTALRDGKQNELGVKAATIIYGGAILCRDANGYAVPGATSATLVALGRCEARADNSLGANDAIRARYRSGVFKYGNSAAADLIARTEIGTQCFIVDDQTVAKTNGGGTRSLAGIVDSIDPDGNVWVAVGIQLP